MIDFEVFAINDILDMLKDDEQFLFYVEDALILLKEE